MQYQNNYPSGGYMPNPVSYPPPQQKKTGLAIASMVCGICSIVLCCVGINLILGILAIIFAIVSKKGQPFSGFAIAGLICGIIGVGFGIYSLYAFYAGLTDFGIALDDFLRNPDTFKPGKHLPDAIDPNLY